MCGVRKPVCFCVMISRYVNYVSAARKSSEVWILQSQKNGEP